MKTRISVRRASATKHWRDFYQLRRTLYANDPAAVIPLRQMEVLQLDTVNNPFYEHARREVFICYRDGQPAGRIVAIKDDMHNDWYKDKVGFFGFFECIDDAEVANALIEEARQWCREQGCDQIRGPVNPSMKSEFGVLVQGNEYPPFIAMGHTHEYYDGLLQGVGLDVAKTFYAYRYDSVQDNHLTTDKWKDLARLQDKIFKRHPQLSFRKVEKKNFAQTMLDINKLGNKVRATNYGFVPLTEAELLFNIQQLSRVIDYDMIHVAYWEDRLVGFIVNIPDVNWAISKTRGKHDWIRLPQLLYWMPRSPRTRVIALGVDEDFRKKGIAMLLIKRLADRHLSFREWEFSWVVEDNVKSIRAIGRAMPLIQYKTYRLYEGPVS